MALIFHGHPFSSYCQKALIALYEAGTPFAFRLLAPDEPENGAAFAVLWPLQRMPVLVDGGAPVREATIIIEHLDLFHPGPARMIPADPRAALAVRFMDRVFDNYVMTPMQRIVFDFIRAPEARDPAGVADARALLDRAYAWLDAALPHGGWAHGDGFCLTDCAAAPSLLYADWVHPIAEAHANLRAYRTRLLTRPTVARAVDEARPYRHFFPPGDPGRD